MNFINIYGYFPKIPRREINKILDKLPERAIEVLKLKYGPHFKNPKYVNELSPEDNDYFEKCILYTIRKEIIKLSKKREEKTFYEYFPNESLEDINFIISTLSLKAKYILNLKYGSNLTNPALNILSKEDENYFKTYVIRIIKKKLIDLKNGCDLKEKSSNIYEYFKDYTYKEIDEALKFLPKEYLEIIYKKYGDNLIQPNRFIKLKQEESVLFNQKILPKIKRILVNLRKEEERKKLKTIYDYFPDYSQEEIDFVIQKLSKKAKRVLNLKYGNNLKNPISDDHLTIEDKKYFEYNILPKIRKKLEVNQEILKSNLKKEDYKKLINILKEFILAKLLTIFTYEESIVIILKIMLNYDTEVISYLLNISCEEILDINKKFLTYYKDKMLKDIKPEIKNK